MGIGRASGASSSHTRTEYVYIDKKLPNPDPKNFTVLNELRHGKFLMVEVHYPDATNFEGRKIMIYENVEKIDKGKPLDPHFAKGGISPIIRLRPTSKGWMLGAAIMRMLSEID